MVSLRKIWGFHSQFQNSKDFGQMLPRNAKSESKHDFDVKANNGSIRK